MQVFTTIFLAETLSSTSGRAEDTNGVYADTRDFSESDRASLERIATLESRNWFVDDLSTED